MDTAEQIATEPIWISAPEIDPQATIALTDLGNAKRFALAHKAETRFCHLWKKWLVWDGSRWKVDDTQLVYGKAKRTVVSMLLNALLEKSDDARAELLAWEKASESEPRIRAMLALAQSEDGIPIRASELDKDQWLFNCANATLNLRTGEAYTPTQADFITRKANVDYVPGADCPLWNKTISEIFDGNEEMVAYLQRWAGYALTGSCREHALLLAHGTGANGKTTLLETLRAIWGDYSAQTDFGTFLLSRGGGIRNDIARLAGVRVATAVESEEGKALAESLVKSITGSDKVSARFLYQEFFEFTPSFKIFLATNHKPQIKGTGAAIWRRIRLVPFNVSIPPAKQDKDLLEKLQAEFSGILNWALAGLQDYLVRGGLADPPEVLAATEVYKTNEDILGAFLDTCCARDRNAETSAKELFARYKAWAEETGERRISQKALGVALAERGFTRTHKGTGNLWGGIAIRDESFREDEPEF